MHYQTELQNTESFVIPSFCDWSRYHGSMHDWSCVVSDSFVCTRLWKVRRFKKKKKKTYQANFFSGLLSIICSCPADKCRSRKTTDFYKSLVCMFKCNLPPKWWWCDVTVSHSLLNYTPADAWSGYYAEWTNKKWSTRVCKLRKRKKMSKRFLQLSQNFKFVLQLNPYK